MKYVLDTNIVTRLLNGDERVLSHLADVEPSDVGIPLLVLAELLFGAEKSVRNELTNCVNPIGETTNGDIEDGDFRYLDLRLPPFCVEAEELFSFTNYRRFPWSLFSKPRWRKKVLLVKTPE